jgi:uncharacterized lipoprotein
MNFDEILNKILEIAQFPQDKRGEFVTSFYEYLYMELVSNIREVDSASADKIMTASSKEADAEGLKKVFDEVSRKPKVKEVVDKVTNDVVQKLVDDVGKFATEEQRQKILAVLSL